MVENKPSQGDKKKKTSITSSRFFVDYFKPFILKDLNYGTSQSLRLFIFITIILIVISGLISLLILHFLPNLGLGLEILIDLLLLIFVIVPIFIIFAYQPLLRYYRQEKETQVLLEQTNEKIQKLEFELEQSPTISYTCSFSDGFPIKSISNNITHFGYSSEELIKNGIFLSEIVHPDDFERLAAEIREGIAAGLDDFKQDFRILTKNGDVRWVISYNWINRYPKGDIKDVQGVMLDVTNRIKSAQNFQQAEQLVESIFSMTHVLKAHLDHDIDFMRVNGAFSAILGEPVDYFPEKNFFDLFPDIDLKSQFEKVIRENETIVIHDRQISALQEKDSNTKYWDWVVQPIRNFQHDKKGIMLSMIEVTDHALARKEIELERNKLMQILNTMQDGIYIVNENHEIEYVNPIIEKEFGEFNDQRCFEYFHGADEPCSHCRLPLIQRRKVANYEQQISNNGKIYDVLDIPLDNPDGSLSKLKVMHDITKRKANEESLQKSIVELELSNQEAQKQRKLAEALAEASFVLNRSLELDEVIEHILNQVRKGIPFSKAFIFLLKRKPVSSDRFHSVDGDFDPELTPTSEFPYEEFCLYSEMKTTKTPILIPDTTEAENWEILKGWEWIRSFLSVPILLDKKVIGFINLLDHRSGAFNQEHSEHLTAFASQAAIAIENAWLFEQIREGKERLQILSHHQTKILEDERQYIARELHDEAGQALTGLMLDMQLIESQIDNKDYVLGKVKDVNHSLVNVSESLHDIAMTLRPASLDHLGLVSAINQYVDAIKGMSHVNIVVKHSGIDKRLPHNIEIMIYRIVQEALTNVIRHAHATRAEVVLQLVDHRLLVSIQDDGIGFDPGISPTPSHIGLLGMRERVEIVNGKLSIESTHKEGTKILVEVDCDNPDTGC